MEKIALIYAEAQGRSENLRSLFVPEGMQADYIAIPADKDLLAGYQEAMNASDARYKVYLNGDIRIVDQDILGHIVQTFQSHPEIGILGLSGARQLSTNGISYTSKQRAGRLLDPAGKELVFSQSKGVVEPVEALDGYFLATQYDVPWRSDLLHAPIFLGASASCEQRRAGHTAVVLPQKKAACQLVVNRFSLDKDDQNAFLDEYSKDLYPLVSICIPTYQRPDYFREALESVLHQTYRNLDIFVTDDSADDRTEALIQPYLEKDGRITYEHHPEFKAEDNWRNIREYDNPAAEYVGWLMDDDKFLPDKISFMVDAYRDNPDVTLVTSYRHVINADGQVQPDFAITKRFVPQDSKIRGTKAGNIILTNCVNFIGEPSTVLMCKKFFTDHQYRWTDIKPEYDIGDVPIWLNLLSKGNLFYYAEPLSCFRLHGKNAQTKFSMLTGGTVCWSELIAKAWREHTFLETEKDYQNALQALLQMGLRFYDPKKMTTLTEETRRDFENALGNAFLALAAMPGGAAQA